MSYMLCLCLALPYQRASRVSSSLSYTNILTFIFNFEKAEHFFQELFREI